MIDCIPSEDDKERHDMRAIIVGAGKVGFNIAQMLSMEGHDVVIIEKNEERLQIMRDHLDIQSICGSGSDCEYWKRRVFENQVVYFCYRGR